MRLLCCLCVTASLAGCGVFTPARFEAEKALSVPHVADSPIDVETANGSITVTKADRKDVQIEATVRATTQERADAVKVTAERDGDSLRVRVTWPDGAREPNEGCNITIAVPDARGVALRSSNGRLTVAGLGGPADLRTSNGRINVKGHAGRVTAESSNGRITVGGRVTGPVELTTSNGAVELELGSEFRGKLSLRTSNGSVKVSDLGEATLERSGRSRAVINFGDGPDSRVKTSNGSIRVSAGG